MISFDSDAVANILAEKATFESEDDEAACKKLVKELSSEEQEIAATSSYAYWLATIATKDDLGLALNRDEIRMRFAIREARRHYVGQDRDFNKALAFMKEAISLRVEYRVDLIRWIHAANNLDSTDLSVQEQDIVKKYRDFVVEELQRQLTVTTGLGRDNQAVVIRFPRTSPETEMESFLIAQIYIAERGCAATEYHTRGQKEQLIAVADYANYSSANAPPMLSLRESMSKLQRIYTERLSKMIMSEPPFWMRMLYNLLSPFLAEKTTKKIAMVSGDVEKKATFDDIMDVEKPLPLMNQDLTMSADGFDVEAYINQLMYETLEES
ncbi:hypothetical protein ACA910_012631 [Epithemia clementina (nom. ined.)]